MENQIKIIESLRKQLAEMASKCNALDQKNALLEDEIYRLKKAMKPHNI